MICAIADGAKPVTPAAGTAAFPVSASQEIKGSHPLPFKGSHPLPFNTLYHLRGHTLYHLPVVPVEHVASKLRGHTLYHLGVTPFTISLYPFGAGAARCCPVLSSCRLAPRRVIRGHTLPFNKGSYPSLYPSLYVTDIDWERCHLGGSDNSIDVRA